GAWSCASTLLTAASTREDARAEAVADLRRRERDARDLGLFAGDLDEDEVRALAPEGGLHRGLDVAGRRDGDGGAIAGRDREAIESDLVRERGLVARGAVDPVIEHAVDQVRRPAGPDLSEDAQIHQEISVAVEDDRAVMRPGQCQTQADRRRHAHG